MKIRCKWAVAAGLVALLGVSAQAAETKKTKVEKGKASAETNATVNLTTNELKPKIDFKVYKISPTDVVEIKVYREDDLTTKQRIAKDGTIAFPFLTVVNIGGKTVEEAANHIKALLAKDYLVNPQVSVSVLEYAKRWFHVVGQANRQGPYPIPEEETMDLARAIAAAGGFTPIAKRSKVTITRMIDGKKVVLGPFDVDDKKAKPIDILPDDIINVPTSIF